MDPFAAARLTPRGWNHVACRAAVEAAGHDKNSGGYRGDGLICGVSDRRRAPTRRRGLLHFHSFPRLIVSCQGEKEGSP